MKRRITGSSVDVTEAAEAKVARDDLAAMLVDMLAETGGPMTTSERRAADRVLGVALPSR